MPLTVIDSRASWWLVPLLLAGFGAAAWCNPANAYQWDNDYGVNISAGRDDNFRLSESDELETTSSRVGAFANLRGTTEISELRFTLGANSTSYSESEIDDSDSYRLSLDTSRRGERLSGNLNVSAETQSTTETELLDTGAVIDGERETASVSPGLSYRVDERNSVSASVSARDVTYDTVSLTEYTDNAVSLGWSRQLDETRDFSVSVRASEYDPEDDDPTDINSFSLGYGLRTSAVTRYTFSAGYSDVDRPRDSETGTDYGIAVDHQVDERNNLQASLSNSYQASGAGEVRDEDRLDLQWNRGLSDRASMNVSAQAVSNDDRDYLSLGLGASYRYTREISLGADLRYRQQESDTVDADSRSVFFSLSYSPI